MVNESAMLVSSGRMAGHLRTIMSYRGGLFKHELRTKETREEFCEDH